ncbi:hypothetical protein HN789_05215 [archaeon]|nr:hypothetical protein [archaeon]MBT4022911.1 hypothetical protein [archaeon]MBT4272558.1 hypothetical protein [archaeon]MBT4460374.1 hypothetical protein [archaeon]MBT4859005.1 hypothetical protein [archaeon]
MKKCQKINRNFFDHFRKIKFQKRGQVSMEFITIFGFVFLMTIPLIIVFFDQVGSVKDSISSNHLRNIAIKITDKAETIYYLGEPSKSTIKTFFPDNIEYINFTSRTVIFGYKTSSNTIREMMSVSQVNITGSLSTEPGTHYIEIVSLGDEVSITE